MIIDQAEEETSQIILFLPMPINTEQGKKYYKLINNIMTLEEEYLEFVENETTK